jgi:phytoene dehydrogenase-like protein
VELRFGNGLELLEAEIERAFPAQRDAFARLLGEILDYDELDEQAHSRSAREVLSALIGDPLLVEMLFCPLMWYGNAREHDMDFGQFCIMFRSIFMEGFARPLAGVRLILKNLVRRYRELGGELKLRSGVERIHVEQGRATGVVLDDGTELTARRILSSAGWVETMRMCDHLRGSPPSPVGQMTFFESISVLDIKPQQLGHDRTIVFFNDSEVFHWCRSEDLCDVRTGVICSPNNYLYGDSQQEEKFLPDGVIRITSIANFDRWNSLTEPQYALEKLRWYDRGVASAVRFMPDFRGHVIETDMFTPSTIRRFTWHDNGAVYGCPDKRLDGTCQIENLYLCGTDQGFVGIIGSIISGIAMANRHCLQSS